MKTSYYSIEFFLFFYENFLLDDSDIDYGDEDEITYEEEFEGLLAEFDLSKCNV